MTTERKSAQSERMKRRWAEHREEMLAVTAAANAKASERTRTRWQKDFERMRAMAIANAAAGSAALAGSEFSPERSAAHSAALIGRDLGGQMARGSDENIKAKSFALLAPDGTEHRGRNLLEFVRAHRHLFSPDDVTFVRGPSGAVLRCRAYKALVGVRTGAKRTWKGWTRVSET